MNEILSKSLFGHLLIFLTKLLDAFLGMYPLHMEVPKLGIKLEQQLQVYTNATATPDRSCIYNVHHSSWQRWILNPLSKAKDQTCLLMHTSGICYC